jgi:RNA polymerase sigma factor (sigma-70 family)
LEQTSLNIHQDIIDRCLEGDRMAQYELYKLYSKAMYNVSFRIVHNENDAEDVLQEAFVSAFKNLAGYSGVSTFGAWLKRIVINKSLNYIKKRHVEITPVEVLPDVEEEEPVFNESIDLNINQIKKAVDMLPDGYRVVFSLYLLEGYDHGEIAEILGITESTSKSQFNRSKKKLKEILEKEAYYER